MTITRSDCVEKLAFPGGVLNRGATPRAALTATLTEAMSPAVPAAKSAVLSEALTRVLTGTMPAAFQYPVQ